MTLSGSNDGDTASALLGNLGLAHHLDNSRLTLGMGLLTAGGFSANYPADTVNPILTPPAPRGVGLGNAAAELQVFQIVPAVSIRLTDCLSIGASPIVDVASLRSDPFVFATPDDANGDGVSTFPGGYHSPFHWGGGFQAGVYLTTDSGWAFGASLKSRQWFEKFRYTTIDELGRPRRETLRFEFPLIASLGVSYDVRYIDYRNTEPFRDAGLSPQGAVRGLGYESILAVSLGGQYLVSDRLSVRAGYTYNDSPLDDEDAVFNVGGPVIIEHTVYAGLSWRLSSHLLASLAYVHGFENTIEGPFAVPLGPVPGTSVKSQVYADALTVGVTVRY
jgi:long-chain fatty acid transport protein